MKKNQVLKLDNKNKLKPDIKDILKPINFYSVMPKKFLQKTHNPHYDSHKLIIPFRMVVVGGTSSMKTNSCFNIIKAMPHTFHKVVIITKNKDEPLYNFLLELIPSLEIFEGINNAPNLDKDFLKTENSLVIFDDLCLEKNQNIIEQYAIRCRKLGVSIMYLTQSWFKTPDTLRKNLSHIVLKKIQKLDELNRILKDYSIGIDKDELKEYYSFATKPDDPKDRDDKKNYFLIDMDADDEYKFRKNLTPIQHYFE
jgi:hypothetical protein